MKTKSSPNSNIKKLEEELSDLMLGFVDLSRDKIEIEDAIKKIHERMKQIEAELDLIESKSLGASIN